jgi:hypothetical protein
MMAAMSYTSCELVQTICFGQTANPAIDSYQDEHRRVWVQEKSKKGEPEVVIQKKGPPRGTQKIADKPKTVAKPLLAPGNVQSHPPQPLAFKYQAPIENPPLVKRCSRGS